MARCNLVRIQLDLEEVSGKPEGRSGEFWGSPRAISGKSGKVWPGISEGSPEKSEENPEENLDQNLDQNLEENLEGLGEVPGTLQEAGPGACRLGGPGGLGHKYRGVLMGGRERGAREAS